MKNRKLKSILLIALGILSIGLIFMAGGYTRTPVFIPEAIQLEPSPIRITADQLYAEYAADEAAADAGYKGKEVWVIEARVDICVESQAGNYVMMRYVPSIISMPLGGAFGEPETDLFINIPGPKYVGCFLQLDPQRFPAFKDVGMGCVVEVVGECQGVSEGVITIKISRIEKTGIIPPSGQMAPW